MNNLSTTQASNMAAFAAVIVLVAKHFKFDVAQEDVVAIGSAVIGIVAIVTNYVHRYKKGDVTLGGFKKF